MSTAPTFEVVRARPWGAYRYAIVGFGREHTLDGEFLLTPSTLCLTVSCSFFDIFSHVHRIFRGLYGAPFVMWAVFAYSVVQATGKSHGVSMLRERGGCIDSFFVF